MTVANVLALVVIGLNLVALPFLAMLLMTAITAVCSRRKTEVPAEPKSRFLFVIPAHNEEAGIAQTVRSCREQGYPAELFQVVVIADNCTDATAEIAAREGAEVVVRHDPVKKTKGYAMEYLIERLKESGRFDQLDALVIVDADSLTTPDLLRKFDAMILQGHDWIQCYDIVGNSDATWQTRLMTYAFSLINGVRPLGLFKLGLSSPLHGNGMCLTTRGLRRIPWKSYGLVEDYEFSWVLRLAGERIAFLPDAAVLATMLEGGGPAAANQRRRWEFGRMEVKKRMLGKVLRSPNLSPFERFASAVELKTPPMMTLLGLFAALAALNLAVVAMHPHPFSSPLPITLTAASVMMIVAVGGYAISPFLAFGLPPSYLLTLAYIPIYAVWKVSVRLGGKPTQWIRTARTTGQ